MKSRKQKQDDLDQLKKDFAQAGAAYLVDFKGLTVGEDNQLRSAVARTSITYRVVKNTLARIACDGTGLEPLREKFSGTTGVALTADDPVAAAKLLTEFARTHAKFVFKAGIVDGRVIDVADIERLATMPSKEELISKMMFLINSGAQRMAVVASGLARNIAIVIKEARAKDS